MKRSLFLAAVATLAGTSALAQSSVTIYGRLNTSVERQKDGDTSVTALQNNASRIGFKGTEDLGGGLKASFLLEHGFNVDTGAQSQGAFWARESWVALEGSFGRVRLGNMGPTAAYFATADYISMHNHDTGTSSDAFYLYPGDVRNTIAYNSPSFGGVTFDAQVGLAETTNTKKTIVLAANYVGGPLHLGASYVNAPTGLFTPPADDDSKEFGLRALYEMGPLTFGAYYIRNTIDDGVGTEVKRNSYRLSAMYTMGVSEFHLNYGVAGELKGNGNTLNDTDATQFTFAYNYNLSKRTKVFAFYTQVDNKDNAAYSVSNVGTKFSSFAAGVRHNF
ncbi:porin [uncultured Piscinibacter sp.]|uniref:porin n=1 Tax=uncultured Piscinibacter sp. TaxID=1131835 RepID=UPI002635D002|nr:porin [uncultured Piscinibacter sp.]